MTTAIPLKGERLRSAGDADRVVMLELLMRGAAPHVALRFRVSWGFVNEAPQKSCRFWSLTEAYEYFDACCAAIRADYAARTVAGDQVGASAATSR
jgi:hypothetical protein